MARTQIIENINLFFAEYIASHGGIDMQEFYENYSNVTVEDIIEGFVDRLVDNLTGDEHQKKINTLVPQRAKKEPGEKKLRDPDKPTRGKSAYLFFCQDHRAAAKEELEELGEDEKASVGQVTKKLGEMWREFKEDDEKAEELAVYEASANEDKERYDEQMKGYTELTQEEIATKIGPKRQRKPSGGPKASVKRARSAYNYFCVDNRERVKKELEDATGEAPSAPEVTAELAVQWNDIKTSTTRKNKVLKQKYDEMAEEDKTRYENEKSESDDAKPVAKAAAKPSAKPAAKAVAKAVAKPVAKPAAKPVTKPVVRTAGFKLFCTSCKDDVKEDGMKPAEIVKALRDMWDGMDETQKAEWEDAVEDA